MLIRGQTPRDVLAICRVFQMAFAEPPWNEHYTEDRFLRQWGDHSRKPGFRCLVAEEANRVVGATWWDAPNIDQLRDERGDQLADYCQAISLRKIVWFRETCVDPNHGSRGIAKQLKQRAVEIISDDGAPVLLLTRMRDDNPAIIRINSALGLQRTGIKVPSKTFPGVFHEYWQRFLEVETSKGEHYEAALPCD